MQFMPGRPAVPFSLHAAGRMGPSAVNAAGARLVKHKHRNLLLTNEALQPHRRAGSENVAGIVNLGMVEQTGGLEIEQPGNHLGRLRDLFESRLARGSDTNLALNGIGGTVDMDDSLQETEASTVKLQQMVNKLRAVNCQTAA